MRQIGREIKQRFRPGSGNSKVKAMAVDTPSGMCRAQVVRSVSEWSHGVPTERSIQHACEFSSVAPSAVWYSSLSLGTVCRPPTYP